MNALDALTPRRLRPWLAVAWLLPVAATAQQVPLTGQMLSGLHRQSPAPVASPRPAPPPAPAAAAADASYPPASSPPRPAPAPAPASPRAVADAAAMAATRDTRTAAAMPAPVAAPTASAPTHTPYPYGPRKIGDVTRFLLQAQANGDYAGPGLPMLGNEATAAYKRYMDSFKHPIPEFFQNKVKDDTTGSAN